MKEIHLSKAQRDLIEYVTRGQSQTLAWIYARNARLTSSRHHEIDTKVKKAFNLNVIVKPKMSKLADETIDSSSNATRLNSLAAIKYGRKNEKVDLPQFYEVMASQHSNFVLDRADGLLIEPSRSYIASSPDARVSCDCCGKAVVEIKCPLRLRSVPVGDQLAKLEYIESKDDKWTLKSSHQYFTQIQSEMGVAQTEFGYFVIWSPVKLHHCRINFDSSYYKDVTSSLDVFFKHWIAPILVGEEHLMHCGSCSRICLRPEEIGDDMLKERSVCCDQCQLWFHYGCQSVPSNVDDLDNWFCLPCVSAMFSDVHI